MLEAIRTLRLELDSLLESLRRVTGIFVTSAPIRRRIEQFYLSWSNFRPILESAQLPPAVIRRAEDLAADVVRLTVRRSRREDYRRKLIALRGVLTREILLEIARLGPSAQAGNLTASAAERSILPEIPGLTNDLIPNSLYGFADKMRTFLKRNTYDHNVFVMVAYRPALSGLLTDVQKTLRELELNPIVARDHALTEDLYNPQACLLCCQFGVAIFDKGDSKQLHNANIVYELAMMHMLKRQCLILKHAGLKTMPSDFLHKLYESYKTTHDAVEAVKKWWGRLQKLQ